MSSWASSFSVAMCTYNGSRFLEEQLATIAEQTVLPHELVVRDDASTDATVGMLRDFARQAPFPVTITVNRTNVGTMANVELVVRDCRCGVIALADQDDRWAREKLASTLDALESWPGAVAAFSDATLIDERNQVLSPTLWQAVGLVGPRLEGFADGGPLRDPFYNYVTGATLSFRAELVPLLLPVARNLPGVIHDGWFAYLASLVGRVVPIGEPLIQYRQHPGQQLGVLGEGPPDVPLGPPRPGIRRFLPIPGSAAALARELRVYNTILERALDHPTLTAGVQRRDLERRCRHLTRRVGLGDGSLRDRLVVAVGQLLAGNYARYANDRLAPLRDLLGSG